MKAIPSVVPSVSQIKRFRRQRREHMKRMINDMTRIATVEIEKINELATELLTEESDDTIAIDQEDTLDNQLK